MRSSSQSRRGASLLEAVIAAGLLATVLAGLVPLVNAAMLGAATARGDLLATHLARQRLGQLQALTHTRTPTGYTTDTTTRVGADGFDATGSGLSATGPGPLLTPTMGFSEWLDARGALVGPGHLPPPAGALLHRRWGVVSATGGCVQLWVQVSRASRGSRPAHAATIHCPWGMVS